MKNAKITIKYKQIKRGCLLSETEESIEAVSNEAWANIMEFGRKISRLE